MTEKEVPETGTQVSEQSPDRHGPPDDGVSDAAFRQLHEAARGDSGAADRRRALLSVVREALDAATAVLVSVDDETDRWRVVDAVGARRVIDSGDAAALHETFCRHTVEADTYALPDAREAVDDLAYWRHGLGAYLGARVDIGGETFGTVAVADAGPRESFDDREVSLVRAAASVVAADPELAAVDETVGARPLSASGQWFEGGMLELDDEGRVRNADDGAVEILGRPAEAVVGETLAAALDDAEDRRPALAVRAARSQGEPVAFEAHRAGGTWLWVGVYPASDGARAYVREATARREHEAVLERVTDGFLSLDRDLHFTYANGRAGKLLASDPDELVGTPLPETTLVEDDDGPDASSLVAAVEAAAQSGETEDFELHAAGDRFVHGRAYPDEGGLSVYLHDETERHERERVLDELLDRTRDLMRADDRETVAQIVANAVDGGLDFEGAEVHLYRDDRDLLVPVATLEGQPLPGSDHSIYSPGDGLVGRAYESREMRFRDEEATDADGPDVAVPLGDHGVVSVRGDGSVEDSDVSLVALLAETAVVALDRARRSEQLSLYEKLLESGDDMVYAVDETGTFSFVSGGFARRLGRDRSELVGEHLSTVLPKEGVEKLGRTVRRLPGEATESAAVETTMETADGEQIPVEVLVSTAVPGDDGGAVGLVRQIADLEAVREELSQERTRFSQLFENLPDPALEMEVREGDDTSTVRSVNPAFRDAFGVSEEVVGRPLSDAFVAGGTETSDPVGRIEAAVAAGEDVSFQLRGRTDEGTRDYVFQAIPYVDTEDCVRAFGIYTDITEQRERERRLEVLNRVLRHNMRSRLNVVDGYADYLAEELEGVADRAEDGHETVEVSVEAHTQRAAEEVRRAARRVLDLADEARRTVELFSETDDGPVDVVAVVSDVVAEQAEEHPAASFDIGLPETGVTDVEAAREHPPVMADVGTEIGLAVTHVVENAVVHNDDDPTVTVEVETGGGDDVTVRVGDDGPGIPDHERTVVEENHAPTQLEHGSGLGLWVTRWLVEGYGGEMSFDGDGGEDDGTTVCLRLPSL